MTGQPGRQPQVVGLITFDQTAWALRAHRLLLNQGIAAGIMPIPRQLSASCGLAVRYPLEAEAIVRQLLVAAGVPYHDIIHWKEDQDG